MRKCVITLPITPTTSPTLGLVASILVGDVIARSLGLKFILALGPQLMSKTDDRERTVKIFVNLLSDLGINPDMIWRNDSEATRFNIRKFTIQMMDTSLLTKQQALVDSCPCGIVEKLAEANEWYDKRRLYTREQGRLYRKICNRPTARQEKEVIRFSSKLNNLAVDAYPSFYSRELNSLIRIFLRTNLMVSRSRKSSVTIDVGSEKIYLDQDFAWQMYLATLPLFGYEPAIILGSNHNLHAIVNIIALQHLLYPIGTPQVVIPPYFLGIGGRKIGKEYCLDMVGKNHHKNALRAFVGMSLNWTRKESILQTNQLASLDKLAGKMQELHVPNHRDQDIASFITRCNHVRIRKALNSLRKNGDTIDTESLFGVID